MHSEQSCNVLRVVVTCVFRSCEHLRCCVGLRGIQPLGIAGRRRECTKCIAIKLVESYHQCFDGLCELLQVHGLPRTRFHFLVINRRLCNVITFNRGRLLHLGKAFGKWVGLRVLLIQVILFSLRTFACVAVEEPVKETTQTTFGSIRLQHQKRVAMVEQGTVKGVDDAWGVVAHRDRLRRWPDTCRVDVLRQHPICLYIVRFRCWLRLVRLALLHADLRRCLCVRWVMWVPIGHTNVGHATHNDGRFFTLDQTRTHRWVKSQVGWR